METLTDYCQHHLLIAGPKRELRKFDRTADTTDFPRATDFALQENAPTRIVWQFVMKVPALKPVRILSRRWPHLTFLLHYDCEDCRLVGLARARNGRLRHHQLRY